MKNILLLLVCVLLLAACSPPKYSYHFDHYNYNIGKQKARAQRTLLAANEREATNNSVAIETSPLLVTSENAVASTANNTTSTPMKTASTVEKSVVAKKYSEMSKSEKKEFKKSLIKEIKNLKKVKKDHGASTSDTKMMDYNLKMAIIFGAVAVTLSFFGGVNSVFWILSVVSLVIAVVFFIKWIAEQ
jgi:hypothetical protein